MPVPPSDILENSLKSINYCFQYSRIPYFMSFGGLYALIRNNGTIPDHDLDICTYYGQDWKKIKKIFEGRGYVCGKVMLNDADPDNALYMSFNHPKFLHICLTFWIKKHGIRWYCHDNQFTVENIGFPKIGYFLKGVPAELVDDETLFRWVEWPGINQMTKVRVPRFPGGFLDHMYEDWGYKKSRYNIDKKHTIIEDKRKSYHKGGAISPYMVHLDSIADFEDAKKYQIRLEEGQKNYKIHLKTTEKK